MDIRTNFMTHLAGVGMGILVLAWVVMIGAAQAQNAVTTSSQASLSGIQSVIIHARDAVQRRMRAVRLRSQPQQPPVADSSSH
jgi:hypothetical protein